MVFWGRLVGGSGGGGLVEEMVNEEVGGLTHQRGTYHGCPAAEEIPGEVVAELCH